MKPKQTICEQLVPYRTTDRLCIISEISHAYCKISHIIDEHNIAHDVRFAHVQVGEIPGRTVYEWETKFGKFDDDCPPNGLRLRLERLDECHLLAFVYYCDRFAQKQKDAAVYAAYAAADAAVYAAYAAADAAVYAAYVADAAAAAAAHAAADAAVYAADAAAYAAADAAAHADFNHFLLILERDQGLIE